MTKSKSAATANLGQANDAAQVAKPEPEAIAQVAAPSEEAVAPSAVVETPPLAVKKRKAILHVGTMKTGTTSIQTMLAYNAEWLKDKGFAFVQGGQRNSSEIKRRIKMLAPGQNLIISDEGLWHFANTSRSDTAEIAKALQDFDVTVVVYFRRPDEFIESWFTQGLKNGNGTPSLSDFRSSGLVRAVCAFMPRLKIFADNFGKDSILVAPFERQQMAHGDAVIDFLVRVGLVNQNQTHEDLANEGLVWPNAVNITPDLDTMLLVSLMRQLGKLEEPTLQAVMNWEGDTKPHKTQLLRNSERESINSAYRSAFAEVQATYGGGVEPEFFANWEISTKVPTCALRPLYDRLINGLVKGETRLPQLAKTEVKK